MIVTENWIRDNATRGGIGWTKSQLSALGVKWPPPKGWLESLIGKEITPAAALKFESKHQDRMAALARNKADIAKTPWLPAKQSRLQKFSNQLRQKPTQAEMAVLKMLIERRVKFQFQQTFISKHAAYIADFRIKTRCHDARLIVVEIDGSYHDWRREYDERRTRWFNERGIRVIRFSNRTVLDNPDAVIEGIMAFRPKKTRKTFDVDQLCWRKRRNGI